MLGNLPDGKQHLAVAIPPRHYKTTFISQNLPAWALAEVAPDCEFILTSYSSTLSDANSIAVKRIIESEWYQRLYPHVRVSQKEKNVQNYFKTTSSGCIYSSGLGGTITGFGAGKARKGPGGAVIIDDPLKADNAISKAELKNSIKYYTDTLKSRRNSVHNTPFILIMQRLHPDDLIGWILKNEPDEWQLVSFPALSPEDKLLNSLTTSVKELKRLKEVAPQVYYAQYQQTPIIEGGNIIKLDWWRYFDLDQRKQSGPIILTADTAFGKTDKSDYSVIRAWEIALDGIFCLDAIYGRWDFPTLTQKASDFWEKWKLKGAREFWIEDQATGAPLAQQLNLANVPAIGWKPTDFEYAKDKVGRMSSFAFTVHAGKVFLPRGNETVVISADREENVALHAKILMEECAAFSRDMTHSYDDHCDTATMIDSLWKNAGGEV